jgi:glycosyltransferase involved in cell wall biosynthesis
VQGISVVICTYNGIARLAATLESIVKQENCNFYWELLVIDNASTDDTAIFCKQFLREKAKNIDWRVIIEAQSGLNFARLNGLNSAKYDVVLFCDDDNHLCTQYLNVGHELMYGFPKIGALGGHGIPLFEEPKPEWFDKYAPSFAVGAQAAQNGKLTELPAEVYGAGCFFRAKPLKEIFGKGFKTIMTDRLGKSLASGGDVEWCYLVQLAGYEIWYDDRLKFHHLMPASRMNWEYYLRLKAGISGGAARLFTYALMFENSKLNQMQFLTRWYKQLIGQKLTYAQYQIFIKAKRGKLKRNEQLALAKMEARANAFAKDRQQAWQHYQQLQQVFLVSNESSIQYAGVDRHQVAN